VHTPIEETMAALEDLVRAGKVRYIGVSDTPAWKIAEANVMARFRGWSAFIGLQIEYSLLERTVEQELVPMALEFGLGITPWSPLKSGVLSGKYTRKNAGQVKADRRLLRRYPISTRRPMRSSMNWRSSPRRTTARWRASRWPGSRVASPA
jgi:aryl-alcohol dehydrogenase-like predicted oxidoreductase